MVYCLPQFEIMDDTNELWEFFLQQQDDIGYSIYECQTFEEAKKKIETIIENLRLEYDVIKSQSTFYGTSK